MDKTLVIVPTYNEVENIPILVDEILGHAPEVHLLVVDDNSPDGTGARVKQIQKLRHQVYLLERSGKQGLAQAYIAGFLWGMERKYDRMVQMDADFSHRPVDLPKLLQALGDADVAIGARYVSGGATQGWSRIRQGISRGGNLYARGVLGLEYSDLTGGFNAWKRNVLEKIEVSTLRSRGYAFQVELKYRAHRAGFRVAEVPIQFDNRRFGESKMSANIVWEAAFRVLQMRTQ